MEHLSKLEVIGASELEFAHFLIRLYPNISVKQLLIGIAHLHFQKKGHVAVDQELIDKYLIGLGLNSITISLEEEATSHPCIGKPGDFKLFIYDQNLLYNHKGFSNESRLASWFRVRMKTKVELPENLTSKLFSKFESGLNDPQIKAVLNSFFRRLLFITGGPGTGKTYTVRKIIEEHRTSFGDTYKIKIAAPTGKAAQRINDSLSNSDTDFPRAVTIHQLLGATNSFSSFTNDKRNPLPIDLLIVDEASMMDLALWVALIDAVPESAKLIIVGDPYQLASVESGSVLNDITSVFDGSDVGDEMKEAITVLSQNFRFSDKTGIQELSNGINSMNSEEVLSLLDDSGIPGIQHVEPSSKTIAETLEKYAIEPGVTNSFRSRIDELRILCAVRYGPYGTIHLNQIVETEIKRRSNIPLTQEWFDGRLVLITKNDYQLDIQNGETGVYDAESDTIYFNENKRVNRMFVKNYEPGYCITIHKSQGSEFNHVAIALPDKEISLLTKELLYTAVTRARQSVLVIGSKQIIAQTVTNRIFRRTGLKKRVHV